MGAILVIGRDEMRCFWLVVLFLVPGMLIVYLGYKYGYKILEFVFTRITEEPDNQTPEARREELLQEKKVQMAINRIFKIRKEILKRNKKKEFQKRAFRLLLRSLELQYGATALAEAKYRLVSMERERFGEVLS